LQAEAAEVAVKVATQVSKSQKTSPTSSRSTLSNDPPLSIVSGTCETNTDFGLESGSDDDDITGEGESTRASVHCCEGEEAEEMENR